MGRKRKPGGGRKPSKPDYNPSAILQNQMNAAVALYSTDVPSSLQTIADELDLNPIKVRKLLITAGVYKSDAADQVQRVFNKHGDSGLSHTESIAATMRELNLSKASVTSYLPYMSVLDGVRIPIERTAALLKWNMVGEVLIPGVLNVGDIEKTDGCQKAADLAKVF